MLSAIFVAELVAGLLTGSLALLADAVHLLTDVAAITLALVAQWVGQRPACAIRSFGWRRVEVLSALINGLTLWAIAGYIIYEAIVRLQHPPRVASLPMVLVATLGLVVQVVAALILARGRHTSINVKGAYVHAATDAVQSAAVVGVGLLMMATGWWLLDPAVSVLIALLIAYSGGKVVLEAGHILLEATPREFDLSAIAQKMLEQDGVVAVADLHAWAISSGFNALSAHVLTEPSLDLAGRDRLLARLSGELRTAFPLHHLTLQLQERDVEQRCGCWEPA